MKNVAGRKPGINGSAWRQAFVTFVSEVNSLSSAQRGRRHERSEGQKEPTTQFAAGWTTGRDAAVIRVNDNAIIDARRRRFGWLVDRVCLLWRSRPVASPPRPFPSRYRRSFQSRHSHRNSSGKMVPECLPLCSPLPMMNLWS